MEFVMSDAIAKFNVQLLSSMKALQNRIEALNHTYALSSGLISGYH